MGKKIVFIALIGLFSAFVFARFSSDSAKRSSAFIPVTTFQLNQNNQTATAPSGSQSGTLVVQTAPTKINFTVSPKTSPLPTGSQVISFVFTPLGTQGVAGFFIYFSAAGNISITDISQPTSTDGPLILNEFSRSITGPDAVLGYILNTNTGGRPSNVKLDVTVQKGFTGETWGILSLDTVSSAFYPDLFTSTSVYDWGTVERADFGTNVPTPSITPTPTPLGCSYYVEYPTNLSPDGTIGVSSSGTALSWTPVAGADHYVLLIREVTPGSTADFTTTTRNSSYVYTKFQTGRSYTWTVRAVDQCGNESIDNYAYLDVSGTITPVSATPSTPVVATKTPTPTPKIPPVNVSIRLRFQAIYTNPTLNPAQPQVFVVWVRNTDRETPVYKWTRASYDRVGSWIINDSFELVPGDGYKVWIKGEKHLQRKICDGRPSDSEAAWYHCGNDNGNIVIQPGDNYLDFSNLIMFAGDIPFKGEGDGVLDAYDLSYIATHFGDIATKPATEIADLNFDGIIDAQDFIIGTSAIRIQKYDETFPYKIHPLFRKVPLHPAFP